MKMMHIGDKWEITVPAELGYQDGRVRIFEMKMLSCEGAEEPVQPAKVLKRFERLKKRRGRRKARVTKGSSSFKAAIVYLVQVSSLCFNSSVDKCYCSLIQSKDEHMMKLLESVTYLCYGQPLSSCMNIVFLSCVF
jgi:hypothetical protein